MLLPPLRVTSLALERIRATAAGHCCHDQPLCFQPSIQRLMGSPCVSSMAPARSSWLAERCRSSLTFQIACDHRVPRRSLRLSGAPLHQRHDLAHEALQLFVHIRDGPDEDPVESGIGIRAKRGGAVVGGPDQTCPLSSSAGRFNSRSSTRAVPCARGHLRSRRSTSSRASRRNPSSPRPDSANARPSFSRACAACAGAVLYAEASHPSPNRATRRRPASEPQLPIQIGGPSGRFGRGSSATFVE